MDISKLAAPKGNGRNQRLERTSSKQAAGSRVDGNGGKASAGLHGDSVQISGDARSLGQLVPSLVSELHEIDVRGALDVAQVESYRERLASGALTTPEVLENTAARILAGIDAEIDGFPSLEQRGL